MARSSLMRWVQRMAASARDSVCEPPPRMAMAGQRMTIPRKREAIAGQRAAVMVSQRDATARKRESMAGQRQRIESRRAFIAQMAACGVMPSMPALAAEVPARVAGDSRIVARPRPGSARDAHIVIVGAGLAGLSAAYELRKAGIIASVVEGAPRAGGRCLSERRAFADNQVAERGGELVDTGHDVLIDLAIELGLPLDDLAAAETAGARSLYFFGGSAYDENAVMLDLRKLWPALARDAKAIADYYPTFRRHTPAQLRLDRLSCAQWIENRVDGGLRSRFGQLLANAYIEELGAEPEEISAITVVGLLAGSPQDRFSPYEESDQRYHIRGGNDQLVERMTASLGDSLRTGTRVVAIARGSDGRMRLALQRDHAIVDELADHIVLALPFTMLRQVDLTQAGFSSRKRRCIHELGMGRNTKLQLQFNDRAWLQQGANGETRVDGSYQVSWEVTRGQEGRAGILNFFSGGSTAARAGEGTTEDRARDALADLQRLLPGIAGSWNGRVIRNAWGRYPWSLGSYSLLKPGQYTTLHGIEDTIEGRVHFAGEQSSLLYAGYMNGAVESGQRAAREILNALGVKTLRRVA